MCFSVIFSTLLGSPVGNKTSNIGIKAIKDNALNKA